jgi:hypothetical protein
MLDAINLKAAKPFVGWLCSKCAKEHQTLVADLKLGGEASHGCNPDIIYLPACPCGTMTFMQRTWDADESADQSVRRAINSLAQHLKDKNQSHLAAKQAHAAESEEPVFTMDLSTPVVDLIGRAAAERARVAAEARATKQAEEAAAAAALAAEEAAAREDREAEEREAARLGAEILIASANINKRLGRPPGSKPSVEELNAELAAMAVEELAGDGASTT